jgi:hypothetical protein
MSFLLLQSMPYVHQKCKALTECVVMTALHNFFVFFSNGVHYFLWDSGNKGKIDDLLEKTLKVFCIIGQVGVEFLTFVLFCCRTSKKVASKTKSVQFDTFSE